MRASSLLVALLALAFVSGCSGNKKTAADDPPRPETDAERMSRIKDLAERTTNGVPEEVYEISEPGTKGWKPSTERLGDLGTKVDDRLANAQNVMVRATITFDDPSSGKMVYRPEIKIYNARTFDVRYTLPEDKGAQSWVRADGSKRAKNVDAAWTYLDPFSSKAKPLSETDVVTFAKRFPELMFARYTESVDVWGPLFDAWRRGVGGYKATIEEQEFKIGGKMRRVYRVVAETQIGDKSQIEVVIDAEALRPTSVKSRGKNEDGSEYMMMWSGQWMVGGKLDPASFKLPKVLPTEPVTT
jgi:hypothetical protein